VDAEDGRLGHEHEGVTYRSGPEQLETAGEIDRGSPGER
jgi:hypothetical protein